MTISEYINNIPDMTSKNGVSLREGAMNAVHIWSNDACRGYCIDAMNRAGLNEKEQDAVIRAMWSSFDQISIQQAEELGK